MAFKKMVGLVYVKRWEERNRFNFYWWSWEVLKVSRRGENVVIGSWQYDHCVGWYDMICGYWNILGQKIMHEDLV